MGMGNREEIMEDKERMELLRGWRRLPDNKPPWETWKRMVGQFHNEALAWDKWIGIVKKKDLEATFKSTN
jgi:hypothetical protein